jgi:VWFA-related protein
MRLSLGAVGLTLVHCFPVLAIGSQNGISAEPTPQPDTAKNRIRLDVVVTDKTGGPVSILEAKDFTLLDDNKPAKIVSFRASDGVRTTRQPVEVILVLDGVNTDFHTNSYARQELAKFLQRNGGHLNQPVSIYLFSDTGLSVLAHPSTDGNALAEVVNQKSTLRMIREPQGGDGDIERFQLSLQAISSIADNQRRSSGRKLLVWIGSGWPILDSPYITETISSEDQQRYFAAIVSLSTRLREARMSLYSISDGISEVFTNRYRGFLKGIKLARQAYPANLSLKVLATQSGGRVLGPNSDLAGQIDNCIADAGAFYTISFDPPRAAAANEYHDLKVLVDKPELTVRTYTGYYDQP